MGRSEANLWSTATPKNAHKKNVINTPIEYKSVRAIVTWVAFKKLICATNTQYKMVPNPSQRLRNNLSKYSCLITLLFLISIPFFSC